MAIIKQYHKDTKTTYVYDSQSYWDAAKGQSRSTRKLLGKIDPETGEIVPTGGRGRKPKAKPEAATATNNQPELAERNRQLQETVKKQRLELEELKRQNDRLTAALTKVKALLQKSLEEINI